MKELIEIQRRLKAPKTQRNSFGGYNYRSAEDILEAVKPLLYDQRCQLTISDDIVEVSGKTFVKATATLESEEGERSTSTVAYARMEDTKKGMDAAQVTGSASSYARKYALNGLFAIDDNKDPDATNTHGKDASPAQEQQSAAKSQPVLTMECANDKQWQEWGLAMLNAGHKLSEAVKAAGYAANADVLERLESNIRENYNI